LPPCAKHGWRHQPLLGLPVGAQRHAMLECLFRASPSSWAMVREVTARPIWPPPRLIEGLPNMAAMRMRWIYRWCGRVWSPAVEWRWAMWRRGRESGGWRCGFQPASFTLTGIYSDQCRLRTGPASARVALSYSLVSWILLGKA
jgi:hypothetical protein